MDTESGPALRRRHMFARISWQYLATVLIAMGVGWMILHRLEWAAMVAWLLMGGGALAKILLSEFSRKSKKGSP